MSVRLFRPEAVLLPSALVSMYSYVDGLAHRLALVPGGGAGDASGQTGQTGQSGPMHAPAGGATPLRTLPGIEEASLGAGGGGSRGGGVRVDVEVRKPRISLVGGGGTKVVVQATIQAQGEIGGARGSGLRFVSWGLEGAQMFVSEEDAGEEGDVSGSAPASPPVRRDSSLSGVSGGRSDASMRSIVDPFDVRVQMSLPEVLSRVPPPPRQAMGEAAQGQVEPGATLGENVVTVYPPPSSSFSSWPIPMLWRGVRAGARQLLLLMLPEANLCEACRKAPACDISAGSPQAPSLQAAGTF